MFRTLPPLRLELATAVMAALLLAGCASTGGLEPDGQLVDADGLASSQSLSAHALSDAAFPDQQWWKSFGDPQLDALIAEALQGNPSLDAADARLRKARAQAGLANAARKPTVGVGAQYAGAYLPETLLPPPTGGEYLPADVLTLDFKWNIDLWGGKRAQWEAALSEAKANEVEAEAARLGLASNLARAYVHLSEAYAARDVAQREHARASELLSLSRQRVQAGLDNQLQVRQAESLQASSQQQEQALQQQIEALGNAIAALMGQGPDRALQIQRPQLQENGVASIPAVLPSELLGHRPDVVAARWRVEAASRGIDAAKASFKPSVNLNLLVGLASDGLSNLFSSDAALGFGGPAISLPIFDGGALRSQLDSRDADYDLAVASYNQSLVNALHEVTDALQSSRSLEQQVQSATLARDAAQSAWELARQRYQAGLGTQLDVLAAQRPLLQLDQQLDTLRTQRLGARIDLNQALGGGLAFETPSSSSLADGTSANPVVTP